MAIVYQTVKWNDVFEIHSDGTSFFIFKNNKFLAGALNFEFAKFLVNLSTK